MAGKPRFTIDQVAEALTKSAGLRSMAAKALGCSPPTVANYIERHKRLQELEVEIVEHNLDMAEGTILTAIKNKNLTATIFFLKTKGRHRGYSERPRVESPGGGGPAQMEARADFSDLTPAGLKAAERIMEQLREASGHGE